MTGMIITRPNFKPDSPLPIRSTQLPRSPKCPDQARPTAVHDFFLTATRPYTTTRLLQISTRQPPRSLLDHPDPYTIATSPTRSLLDLDLTRSTCFGFSAFSNHPSSCRCDLFVFIADLHTLFKGSCCGRVRSCKVE